MDANSEINIDENELENYANSAKDYCLVNGLVMSFNNDNTSNNHNSSICFPVTLIPTKFSKNDYYYALNVQNKFNLLFHKISKNKQFLFESLEGVIKVDSFTKRLWDIYETVIQEGITQPISLGIFRSDYMVDTQKISNNEKCCLSQTEFNTISCALGAVTAKLSDLHKYMLRITNNEKFIEKLPNNQNLVFLAKCMVKAWSLYNNPKAYIAFIVEKFEVNVCDQRLLEYEIMNQEPRIRVVRLTLSEIYKHGSLDNDKRLVINGVEIAIAYYRCGYDPNHYKSENDWRARLLIERSKAIKCPTIQYHLVGTKKVQQELFKTGNVEKFLNDEDSKLVRATFVDQYSFDDENQDKLITMILENCEDFVLKPQREGGGNNIFGGDIKTFINSLKNKSDLKGYILMKFIKPVLTSNYMIKNNSNKVLKGEFASELGIYGCIIGENDIIHLNETGSHQLCTKLPTAYEFGLTIGLSALDSIYLE